MIYEYSAISNKTSSINGVFQGTEQEMIVLHEKDEWNNFTNLLTRLIAKYGAELIDELEAEESNLKNSDEDQYNSENAYTDSR